MSVRIITAEFGSTFDLSSGVFHTLVVANMCQSSPGQLLMLYTPSSGIGDGLGVWDGVVLGVNLGLGGWVGVVVGVLLGLGGGRSGPVHRRSAR
jgi:hypothetical protein